MGQVCSSTNNACLRDPDDKSLETIRMKTTKLEEFDALFSKAADPLNSLVDYNNGIVDAIENIKESSALVQGEWKIVVFKRRESHVFMKIMRMGKDGAEKEVDIRQIKEKIHRFPDIGRAANATKQALMNLNDALSNASGQMKWTVSHGRVRVQEGTGPTDEIQAFNRAVFDYRKKLILHVHVPGLAGAITILKKDLAKELQPRVSIREGVPRISLGGGRGVSLKRASKKLSPRTRDLIKSLDKFQQACTEAAEAMPALIDEVQELAEEAAEFPANAASACSNANLSPGAIMSAMKKTNSNVKALCSGGMIAKAVQKTMMDASMELKDACAGAGRRL